MPTNIDLFLIAGDIVYRGNSQGMKPFIDTLASKQLSCPIYAVYGNDDYDSIKEELREIAGDTLTFLDDEFIIETIESSTVAIIGSRGVLDQPTYWQARYVPGIRKRYTARVSKLNKLLTEAKKQADYTILLTHYTTTYATLRGEVKRIYAQMGSRRVEKLLLRHHPSLSIHGHAHRGKKQVKIHKVPIFNVALPLHKEIVVIDFPTS
jgi:Icc-related predicted phosphoesterase